MNDLTTWLRAQLDEDERLAQAYLKLRASQGTERETWAYKLIVREVEAKRRMIDGCQETLVKEDDWDPVLNGGTGEEFDLARYVLRMLALPFADQPGYRDEWRPE
jgi:hypothetical protein